MLVVRIEGGRGPIAGIKMSLQHNILKERFKLGDLDVVFTCDNFQHGFNLTWEMLGVPENLPLIKKSITT